MSLHELSTNAAKYGALSQPSGRVDITWSIAGDTMEFCWAEQGGPLVEAVKRRGFGQTVLVQMMQRALHGSARLEFPPSGCRWKVTAPLVWVIEPGSGRPANDADSAAT